MDTIRLPKILGMAQINDKGQIVIPKEARDELDLKSGDRLLVALAPMNNGGLMLARPETIEKHLQEMITSVKEIKSKDGALHEE